MVIKGVSCWRLEPPCLGLLTVLLCSRCVKLSHRGCQPFLSGNTRHWLMAVPAAAAIL